MPLEVKLNREAFFFCIECEEGLGRVRYVGNTTYLPEPQCTFPSIG